MPFRHSNCGRQAADCLWPKRLHLLLGCSSKSGSSKLLFSCGGKEAARCEGQMGELQLARVVPQSAADDGFFRKEDTRPSLPAIHCGPLSRSRRWWLLASGRLACGAAQLDELVFETSQ